MTGPDAGRPPVRSRVHRALAAAALTLGLLAALSGEPVAPDTTTAGEPGVRAATAVNDTVASDSVPPRRRLDGRRGCAW